MKYEPSARSDPNSVLDPCRLQIRVFTAVKDMKRPIDQWFMYMHDYGKSTFRALGLIYKRREKNYGTIIQTNLKNAKKYPHIPRSPTK